jgi:subtilase family serine protease
MSNPSKLFAHLFASTLLAAVVFTNFSHAATADRISYIDNAKGVALERTLHSQAVVQNDRGPVEPSFQIHSMLLFTKPSAAQQKELDELNAQQQDRKSANYHKWLTPAQFADRFGLSANDMNKITSWLKSQGFVIESVGGNRNLVRFSGTAGQVQSAFRAEIHRYSVDGVGHFANSTPLIIPAALSGIVTGISGTTDFRMHPASEALLHARPQMRSSFTDTNLQPFSNLLAPADIATIYDIPASADGTGQSIAIIGETDVFLEDINYFRTGFGLPTIATTCKGTATIDVITSCNDPHFQYILLLSQGETDPGAPDSISQDDIGEADLDIEWSGATAPNAKIVYINAPNDGVGASLSYALDPPSGTSFPAPVVSMSYTACEINAAPFDSVIQGAVTDGITFVNSSGDAGVAACDNTPATGRPFQPATGGETVNYPSSSPYTLAVGGTSISLANDSYPNPSSFWTTNGANLGSATAYIPEQAWNDDEEFNSYCQAPAAGDVFCAAGFETGWVAITSAQTAQEDIWIGASGGGASNCIVGGAVNGCTAGEPQPTWQAGLTVANAPAGVRWVPDVSLMASSNFPGYIYCTPQAPDAGSPTYTSTCVNGITGANGAVEKFLSIVGGTSASSPIFAGIVAMLNQATASTTGQGDIHTTLYGLAASSPTAFHQVITGDNMVYCQVGTPSVQPTGIKCPAAGKFGFNASDADATTGYNLVTGLGSVDVGNLITAWTGGSTSSGSFSLAATSSSFAVTQGSQVSATVTLTFNNGFSGTVNLSCSDPASESTCTASPTSTNSTGTGCTTQNGTTTCPVAFAITATAPSSAKLNGPFERGSKMLYAALMPGLFGVVLVAGSRKRSLRGMRMLGLMLVLGVSTMWLGACGGSSNKSSSNPGTPAGNYTITVTGTSNGTTVNTTFTLAVSQ